MRFQLVKNHHAALAQNLQQPSAGFPAAIPERTPPAPPAGHALPSGKVRIHGVDLPARGLLLGLLLPQLLEQGQVLVKIIGGAVPDSVLPALSVPPRRMGSFSALMRARSASACCAGVTGRSAASFPWGYSCGRGNPKNRAGGCNTLWRTHRQTAAARPLPPHALPDFRRPPAPRLKP